MNGFFVYKTGKRIKKIKYRKVNMLNPLDGKGSGFDDEEGNVPGEHAGIELDIHAENRSRNSEGEFVSEEKDLIEIF